MPHITNELYFNRVPWDYAYSNVVNFGSNANFGAYITANCDSTLTILNSTEIRDNTIKVPYNKSKLEGRNINYLTYRNTDHSNRYYGCFITEMHYISEDVTELTFTYDVWNCFYYTATLGQCYVEREHISRAHDTIGANTLAEPIPTGNKRMYYNPGSPHQIDFGDYRAVLYTTLTIDKIQGEHLPTIPAVIKGNLSSYGYKAYDVSTVDGIDELWEDIKAMTNDNKADALLGLYYIPEKCISMLTSSDTFTITTGDYIFGNYTPKNKKLYTKQFCSAMIDNSRGDIQEIYFEKMGEYQGEKSCTAVVDYFLMPTPAIHYFLQGYEGIANNYARNGTITDFQQCMYTIDSFNQYIASHQYAIGAEIIGTTLNAVMNPTSLVSTGMSVLNKGASLLDIANQPPKQKGVSSITQFNNYIHNNYIKTYAFALDEASAKQVDDYLSIYGYQTNRVKVPNMNTRNIFNYVKTQNAEITGVTSSLSKQLSDIFNNGVFIWHNVAQVGNFDIEHNG